MDRQEQMRACCRIRESGTGFLVAADRVATCRHAVRDLAIGDEVGLVFYGGVEVTGRLFQVDEENDAALIAIPPISGRTPLLLADACEGQEPWEGCGYADGAAGELLPLSGDVEIAEGRYGGRPALVLWCKQAGGASVVGFSGSPVIVRDAVVGFVKGYFKEKYARERVAYQLLVAGPARFLRALDPGLPPAPGPLFGYLRELESTTSWIDLQGISSGAGESRAATRHPIESIYTPLRTGGVRSGRGDPEALGTLDGRERVLSDLLPRHPRLLIVGAPGSGKTTFSRLVACMLARDALGLPGPGGRSWRTVHLGLSAGEGASIPIFVRLAELASRLEACAERDLHAGELLHAVSPDTDRLRRDRERDGMKRALAEGRAVLLLDGLDEVTNENVRERVLRILEDACREWPKARIVATSRPFETRLLTDRAPGFAEAAVEPFGRAEIEEFLDRWMKALPGVATGYRAELEEAIVHREEIRRLAENPVMLTCLCVVHWNERRLPNGRAAAYRAVIKWLLHARKAQREAVPYSHGFAERALPELALRMMMDPRGKRVSLGFADAAEAVEEIAVRYKDKLRGGEEPRHAAEQWLRWECTGSGVVQQVGLGTVKFWHLTFQEFLAAERLAEWSSAEQSAKAWWPVVRDRLADPQWAVMLDLFPACLLDKGDDRVDLLLERVAGLLGPAPTLAHEARVAALLHRMLEQLAVYEYAAPAAIKAKYRELLDRVKRIFTLEGARAVSWKLRLKVAEALGQAGDFRLETSPIERLLPVNDRLALGKYPVTVQEFAAFVDAGGYREPRFWDAEGWRRRTDREWESPDAWEKQLAFRNQPVTGVSCFEARAYCAWLAEKTGQPIRLPTEAEWALAATNPGGPYPWGGSQREGPSEEHANSDGHVGRPTPVGMYPLGGAPYGHLDMAGNVWEWCLDSSRPGSLRVLRGGSWSAFARFVRAADRLAYGPGLRNDDVGFRLARGQEPQSGEGAEPPRGPRSGP